MRLQFKHQVFQRAAAKAVTDLFCGQPRVLNWPCGVTTKGDLDMDFVVYTNHPLFQPATPQSGQRLTAEDLLANLRLVQGAQQLPQDRQLARDAHGTLTFSIEMETGTGKTYTYLKTIYELHKLYGWSKFVIVVPSVAIREGVLKSLQTTADHFASEYHERLRYFVYDSSRLGEIAEFAHDSQCIQVMVINMQAFNARDSNSRRIHMELETFGNCKPIDAIAAVRPILIIDEPQSVLGAQKRSRTREGLKGFNPLFALLYSATHRQGETYNQIFRLDALDAYNQRLVKRIEVMGIHQIGSTATNGYLYLDAIVLAAKPGAAPRARIAFEVKGKTATRSTMRLVGEGFDLYRASGGLQQYQDGFVIERIDAGARTVRLTSGLVLEEGQAHGAVHEEALRRIQIRCTIQRHLEREQKLYRLGIKVLSLFFIDRVGHYRTYDEEGKAQRGPWAEIFEEEYQRAVSELEGDLCPAYRNYLQGIDPTATHQGYFSVDRKKRMVDGVREGQARSEDREAYGLIMRDKERLLSLGEPVRFIFSHSALKEGWDNPNVFQICTLKQSGSEVKKRQEIGRGMRLCVNQHGQRQDGDLLGERVFDINLLTIIASESYADFSRALQRELAAELASRPRDITPDTFAGLTLTSPAGQKVTLSNRQATDIYELLVRADYVKHQMLTPHYRSCEEAGMLNFGEWDEYHDGIAARLGAVFDPAAYRATNGRGKATAKFQPDRFKAVPFQSLWHLINRKTYYTVDFDTDDLRKNAIDALNGKLSIAQVRIESTTGVLDRIESVEALQAGRAMRVVRSHAETIAETALGEVAYDLIGELVSRTGLKRKTIAEILVGITPATFAMYQRNPEEFFIRAANIINEQKAVVCLRSIAYHELDQEHSEELFADALPSGWIGQNAIASSKSLYDVVVVDSLGTEKRFAENLETHEEVAVYAKLPPAFYINTPVGKYNPDWAVVFDFKGQGKRHVYFVAETKGASSDLQLRGIEKAKTECAMKHFAAISSKRVTYSIVADYKTLCDMASMAVPGEQSPSLAESGSREP